MHHAWIRVELPVRIAVLHGLRERSDAMPSPEPLRTLREGARAARAGTAPTPSLVRSTKRHPCRACRFRTGQWPRRRSQVLPICAPCFRQMHHALRTRGTQGPQDEALCQPDTRRTHRTRAARSIWNQGHGGLVSLHQDSHYSSMLPSECVSAGPAAAGWLAASLQTPLAPRDSKTAATCGSHSRRRNSFRSPSYRGSRRARCA